MTFKFYFTNMFISFLMLFVFCFSSEHKSIKDINGNPIINHIEDKDVFYIKEDGTTLISYLGGVEFNGGRESLKIYLDSVYYNNPYYNDYSEFNLIENFFILFDKDLNIEEVRIMYRNYADNKRFYYDHIFVDALKNTTGMWHKTVESKEWYIYLHSQRIY